MGANHRNLSFDRVCRDRRSNFLNVGVIICVVFVYTMNAFFGKPNSNAQFLHCYLNDLFAMPFILAYTNLMILWLGKRATLITSPIRIGCLTVFCVIVWEVIAPMVLANSTKDLFDVVAYSIGSFCYFLVVFLSDQESRGGRRRDL